MRDAAHEKTKTDIGNIYSSATKITSNSTRTLKERLFADKTIVTRDR